MKVNEFRILRKERLTIITFQMFQKKTDNTFCMNELNHGECDKLYDQCVINYMIKMKTY